MSRILSCTFAYCCAFGLVYGAIHYCPMLVQDPAQLAIVKITAVLITVALIKVIFKRGQPARPATEVQQAEAYFRPNG